MRSKHSPTRQAISNETPTIGDTDMLGLDNPIHILFLLVLLLLVFGAKRLPEMGRSLGSGMRGFKDSLSGESQQQSASLDPAARIPGTDSSPVNAVTREPTAAGS
jgi:sec-independent protein translocase protein TatA